MSQQPDRSEKNENKSWEYATKVTYLERPASTDETSIAKVIESYLMAHARGDLGILRSHLVDTAIIEVEHGQRKLTREEFLVYTERYRPTIRKLYFLDLEIRVTTPEYAVASYICHRQHVGSNSFHVTRRLFRFTKNLSNQEWHIIHSICLD